MSAVHGDSTRAVHAGQPAPVPGEPFLPGPVFAAPFHLPGDDPGAAPFGYGRAGNPTWSRYESALGELEGGEAVLFASGMAACSALLLRTLRPGDVLVAPADGYGVLRALIADQLEPLGIVPRLVPSDDAAFLDALPGAALVWLESPANPFLTVLDTPRIAAAARDAGALVVVDNTLATPLRRRPLADGADASVMSAAKHLTGHSDLILGHVAVPAGGRIAADALRTARTQIGAIPGPFEAWLAHRSLATLAIRLERQEATADALVAALRARPDVADVRWPGFGSVVCFTLADAEVAQAFLAGARLVLEATSFGGVHTTAERRGRWGMEPVAEGLIRLSTGIEDTADVVADVLAALDGAGKRP